MKWDDLSWPIRTGLSCAVSSLVYLSPVDERANGLLEGRLLAPITASICSLSVLGQTMRSGDQGIQNAEPHVIPKALGACMVALFTGTIVATEEQHGFRILFADNHIIMQLSCKV